MLKDNAKAVLLDSSTLESVSGGYDIRNIAVAQETARRLFAARRDEAARQAAIDRKNKAPRLPVGRPNDFPS